jgi:quercetin dioxygenase-like cupin family protein
VWGTAKTPFVRADLFGGSGEVAVWDLLGGRATPPFGAVLACELAPGGSVGKHRQQELPEVVIGLEGDGEASVNGVAQPLGPGDVAHLPLGAVLAITNRSATAPLRYLIVKAKG